MLKLGIVTQSVESLAREKDAAILVMNNRFWKELSAQLLSLGLKQGRDFFVVFGGERFRELAFASGNELRLPDSDWARRRECARLGYEAYTALNKKYGGLPIWLMHQPSLGDLYIFAAFLPRAMGVGSVSACECVLIVTKNSVKKLAAALGFRHIELITVEEANRNWLMILRLMGGELNVRNAVFHGINNIGAQLIAYSGVTFRDFFTCYTLGLPEDTEPIYPQFPRRKEHVARQFAEHGLIIGKTVVLSPYAGHFTAQISAAQWDFLVAGLKAKGYSVCTNCGGAEEPPLKDTAAPFIALQDCVEFVETAGYFIGVRSGFCDLICMANCGKIVIYESGTITASDAFFGFRSMRLGKGIVELVNDCVHTDALMADILARF